MLARLSAYVRVSVRACVFACGRVYVSCAVQRSVPSAAANPPEAGHFHVRRARECFFCVGVCARGRVYVSYTVLQKAGSAFTPVCTADSGKVRRARECVFFVWVCVRAGVFMFHTQCCRGHGCNRTP